MLRYSFILLLFDGRMDQVKWARARKSNLLMTHQKKQIWIQFDLDEALNQFGYKMC